MQLLQGTSERTAFSTYAADPPSTPASAKQPPQALPKDFPVPSATPTPKGDGASASQSQQKPRPFGNCIGVYFDVQQQTYLAMRVVRGVVVADETAFATVGEAAVAADFLLLQGGGMEPPMSLQQARNLVRVYIQHLFFISF